MKSTRIVGLLLSCVTLGGCAVGNDYLRPDVSLPETYRGAKATAMAADFGAQPWRTVFTDPQLQALIEEALRNSPDVLVAAARIREAEAQAGIARAPALPNVSLGLNTSPIAKLDGDRFSSSFLGAASVSWEIDLWGRFARASEAARAELLGREENRLGVQASLVANVANLYFQLATLHEIRAVTRASLGNQHEVLRLVSKLSRAGIASAAEERQQESAVAATEARLPVLQRQIAETENALSILIGRIPGRIDLSAAPALAVPDEVPAGLPSSLLERRPDVRQAETQLVAANARVGEAKAMFFPSISLTAILGGVSTTLSEAVRGHAAVASLGPSLLQPLYAGGRLVFNRDAALARLDQSLINYRKTILSALAEVANHLEAYATGAELLNIQQRRTQAAREALRLADLRFRAGTTSFLEVLEAQRMHLAAETDAIQSLLERRQALIRLYLAVGGGWADETPNATAH